VPKPLASSRTQRASRETEQVMVIREIMSTPPIALEVTESIASARRKLRDADVRHLPVVDRHTLVGIVSDRDIPLADIEPESSSASGGRDRMPISTVMSSDVLSVDPESDVSEAIDLMIEHKVGAVPVVDAETESLVGIVSYIDLLRAARALLR
jgi:CBS domain-containing protein